MALSLTCEDCGLALRNVQEVQAHSDATGHSNFAESTEKVEFLAHTQRDGSDCGTITTVENAQTNIQWLIAPRNPSLTLCHLLYSVAL